MKRWAAFVALLLSVSLLVGCTDAASYVKSNYDLVDVKGKGKDAAKLYVVEGKGVPAVAEELSDQETPEETSKANNESMMLVYSDKIIHLTKDPDHPDYTLVEIDSIDYAKEHYDMSFLEGYFAATLIGSLFGNDWGGGSGGSGGSGSYGSGSGKSAQSDDAGGGTKKPTSDKPSTSDRTGSFTSKSNNSGKSSGGGSIQRKNDGSTPSYKVSEKPKTSSRIGSFKSKKSK